MAEKISRRCPECGHKVRALAEAFERPRRCPNCKAVVRFVDYPRQSLPRDPDDPVQREVGLGEWVTIAFGAGAALALLGAGVAAVRGDGGAALLLALIALVFLGPVGASALFVLNDHRRLRAERAEHVRHAEHLRRTSAEIRQQYEGFRRNYDAIVAEERDKSDAMRREIERAATAVRNEAEATVLAARREADTAVLGARREAEATVRSARREAEAAVLAARRDVQSARESVARKQGVVSRLGNRFLGDVVKDVGRKLKPDTFALQKGRLRKAIEFCRKHDYRVPAEVERELFGDLRERYEEVLRNDAAKREQARIKAQIREEKRAARVLEQERLRAEAEERAVQEALAEARRQAETLHGAELEAREAEIAELAELLREAESRTERTKSMAELTKAGHVYVISNRGSFGPNVYKIGMTRRLEPQGRVKELSGASVPFPFDVHMMMSCDDAPALENALHKALHVRRVNKVNLRKEYFRTDLDSIVSVVEANHGTVDYTAPMEALEYEQSLEMPDEDFEFVTVQGEKLEREHPEFQEWDEDD